ncbi:MAG: carbohydrate ABC transporter permease [Oscillospiraceae bacterium]|nr:carbohydrate ABC transporter permease [Oscillospiraceae bacterium]
MKHLRRSTRMKLLRYAVLTAVSLLMIYPLLWLLAATLRSNTELFTETGLIPKSPDISGWKRAFQPYGGQIDLLHAALNTYLIALPKTLLTFISVTLTAYGFSRFRFAGRRVLMLMLFSTLFLPQTVLYVPQFVLFTRLGWVDSPLYLPLIAPAALAGDTVFVVMLMQFIRGIPKAYDEAAKLDGCNSLQTLRYVLVPQLRPALLSIGVLQLLHTVNDYMGPLLYVKSPARYPMSVFVKLSMDADSGFDWNRVLAVCCAAMLPQIVIYFIAQRFTTPEAGGLKE